MSKRAGVVFDNDGLLLDTEDAWTRAEETLFARRGRVFTIEHKRSLIGSASAAAARKLEAMLELPGEGETLMERAARARDGGGARGRGAPPGRAGAAGGTGRGGRAGRGGLELPA